MGFQRSSSFFLLAGLALNGVASAPTATQEKVSQLLMQPVGMAQLDLLSAPDMKFDFSTQPNFTFSPGGVTVADTDVYPVSSPLHLPLLPHPQCGEGLTKLRYPV